MAITEIQSSSARADNKNKNPTVAWDNTPTAGNLLIAWIGWSEAGGDSTISLSGWTQALIDGDVNLSGFVRGAFFYRQAGGGESKTVKATLTAARRWTISLVEVNSSTSAAGWQLEVSAHSSGTSTIPASGTTAVTTTANEYWMAGFACQNQATLSSPTNGFAIKEQQVPGSKGSEYTSGVLLTKIVTATGAASTLGTYSNSRPWVGVVATFRTISVTVAGGFNLTGAGSLTASAYYTTPTLVVQAAFGFGPGDPAPVFTDISSYVRSCQWQRGRQNELNQTQAGTATVVLNDPDSHFDPNNIGALYGEGGYGEGDFGGGGSPFYPYIKPGLPVRAIMFIGNAVYPLFYGFAERLPRTSRVSNVYTQRQLELVDGFALLANAGLGGMTYAEEQSDVRVNNVLDDISWSSSARRIGTGVSPLQGIAYAEDDDTRAQTHLQSVSDSENGLLFCDGAGTLVFVGRHELIGDSAYTVPSAVFGDVEVPSGVAGYGGGGYGGGGYGGGTGTPVYAYTNLEPSYDLDQVFNKWVITRTDGEPQVWDDQASQGDYFLRVKQQASLVTTDGEALNQAQWKSGQFSQPLNRVESITIMPLTNLADTARIAAGLGREVGDRITVVETPPGFSIPQSADYVIQHVSGQINTGPYASAELTFLLWPATVSSFWIVGDPDQSLVGVSTKPGY
jgi:hypothetical protein